MTDELKPCPFCGGEATCIENGSHSTAWEIGCYNGQCAAKPSVWEPRKEVAITAWNIRADLATPLDDPRVEALVDLIKRAEHNVPEYYTLWHADARAALEAIASPSIATPLNDPRVKALVEALKEAERMLKHYGSRDAGGMAQIRAALIALEENKLDEPLHRHTWNPPTNFGSKEE